MKAICYKKGGRANASYTDVPEPVLKKDDVLIRVYAACICKPADCAHDGGYSAFGAYPLIPGHEYAGIVEAVGENVTRFKVGDRVTADSSKPCGKCYYCIRGQVKYCENMVAYGQSLNGGFAQLVAVDESLVYAVPDGVTLREASMTELVGCAYNIFEVCRFGYSDEVLIIGAGASGSLLAQLLKNSNCGSVVAVDSVQPKLERLEKYGVETVLVDRNDYDKHEAVLKERYPHGFDVIVDATADSELITRSIDLLKKGGKFINYSFINNKDDVKPVEINTRAFVTREITYIGSSFQHFRFPMVLKAMESHKVDPEGLITSVLPLEKFFEGMDLVWDDPETVKVLIEPNGDSRGM